MNLIQLRYFQAVCACGNLTQAAQQLHISQPSLSSAIQTLEKEFGVGLFVRQYRGVELTAEGEQLLKLSRSLTENADKLVRIMQDLGAGAVAHAGGLHDGGIVAHVVDHAHKAMVENREWFMEHGFHRSNCGTTGGGGIGLGLTDGLDLSG